MRSLMERVGNESLDQGIPDDEALREVFLSGDLEAIVLFSCCGDTAILNQNGSAT